MIYTWLPYTRVSIKGNYPSLVDRGNRVRVHEVCIHLLPSQRCRAVSYGIRERRNVDDVLHLHIRRGNYRPRWCDAIRQVGRIIEIAQDRTERVQLEFEQRRDRSNLSSHLIIRISGFSETALQRK